MWITGTALFADLNYIFIYCYGTTELHFYCMKALPLISYIVKLFSLKLLNFCFTCTPNVCMYMHMCKTPMLSVARQYNIYSF